MTYARVVATQWNSTIRWLDAGCGHQSFADELEEEERKIASGSRLAVGCDLGFDALRKHRSLDKLVCCTLDALPFSNSSFDLITLNNVVEHIEKPEAVFREFARVLETGARIVIHTPNAKSWFVRLVRFGRRLLPETVVLGIIRFLEFREPEDVFPTYYRANSPKEISQILRSAGFDEIQLLLIPGGHLFKFAAPLVITEMFFSTFLHRIGWRELASAVMLVTCRRAGETPVHDWAHRTDGRNAQTLGKEQFFTIFQKPRKIGGLGARIFTPAPATKTELPS